LDNTQFATFDPDHRTDLTISTFTQDKIHLLSERLFLTLGSKFEHNDYTGFEVQPNIRLSYLIDDRQSTWAAVSRAVRIPSRLDADLRLTAPLSMPQIPFPVYAIVNGTDTFDSEKLVAYEAGYRVQLRRDLSVDVASFYNDYDDLQTFEPDTPAIVPDPAVPYVLLPNNAANGMEGNSYGGTLVANWQPLDSLRWQFQYTFIDLDLRIKEGSLDRSSQKIEGNSPSNQLALYSFVDLPCRLSLFTGLRYLGDLPNQAVPAYTELNANLIWRPRGKLEIAIGAENLLHDRHLEFGGNEIGRSVIVKVNWRF
jgi:iron complex outermembrane receptor protein